MSAQNGELNKRTGTTVACLVAALGLLVATPKSALAMDESDVIQVLQQIELTAKVGSIQIDAAKVTCLAFIDPAKVDFAHEVSRAIVEIHTADESKRVALYDMRLKLSDVVSQGVEVGLKNDGTCAMKPGDVLTGYAHRTADGRIVYEW